MKNESQRDGTGSHAHTSSRAASLVGEHSMWFRVLLFHFNSLEKMPGLLCLLPVIVVLAALATVAQQNQSSAPSNATASFATLSAKANAARDADRLEEAKILYKKALALRPRWAEGWWSLGTIAYDQNAYAEAVRAFQKLTALSPKNGNALVMLGLSEFELGRDLLALQHLEKGMSLGLNENEAHTFFEVL